MSNQISSSNQLTMLQKILDRFGYQKVLFVLSLFLFCCSLILLIRSDIQVGRTLATDKPHLKSDLNTEKPLEDRNSQPEVGKDELEPQKSNESESLNKTERTIKYAIDLIDPENQFIDQNKAACRVSYVILV